jgi:hypothetical protein
MNKYIVITLSILVMNSVPANATVTYDTWTSNNGANGANYIITVTDTGAVGGGVFDFEVTVDPWNAEALGVFFDLGDNTVSGLTLSNIAPTGQVALYATDTTSNDCGNGCNLNGISVPLANPDNQWEMVFRLGDSGYQGIQTFSWTVSGLAGISESDFGLVGARAQVLCSGTDLLPDDQGTCGGSDKSTGTSTGGGDTSNGGGTVPEPGSMALLGLGLLAGVYSLRRRSLQA